LSDLTKGGHNRNHEGCGKMPANASLKLVTPTTEIRTVPAGRKTNAAYRSREHLTEAEVEKLLEAARAI
jgi:hypothetical protein